jgi:two-component system, OmpR family, phosphate regulon sensor histidine kinase PhoR
MKSGREIVFILILLFVAITLGLWTEALGWSLFVASIIWIGIQVNQYRKFLNWSKHPLRRPPNGLDSWFTLAYPPFRALQRERQRNRAMTSRLREVLGLTEVIPDGVIVLSPHGDIEGMNTAAKALLQLSDRDIGLGLATVVRSPDFVNFIRAGEQDEALEFASPFNASQSFEARRFDAGTQRTIVLVRDITALNRLLTMRQNFVANVSHELRTPLTVVAGYLETMTDEEQPTDLRLSLIKRLETPVRRMQSLVDDLMLLTQLESTTESEQKFKVNLTHLVETSIKELQSLCSSPDQIAFDCDQPYYVHGIEAELHSVCVNLISNALRYSPEGNPIVVSLTGDDKYVRFYVKDRGFGIAPEHLDRLTERFYRVDLAGARNRGGTGLGLAIVKHILRRHNSELRVESVLGEGSTFFCELERLNESQSPR